MQTESLSSKYVLAYDADCGPCTKFSHAVDILDRYQKIDFISLTRADKEGLLDKIPASRRYTSFHLILPNREEVKSGSDAVVELIAILPGGKVISPVIKLITFQEENRLFILFIQGFQDCMIGVRVTLSKANRKT